MKLYITTQYYENYGSADNPYWKAKGGEDYFYQLYRIRLSQLEYDIETNRKLRGQ